MSAERPILLIEDNPDDEALTLRAFSKNGIKNPIIVAHDGVEATDYLFSTGMYQGRDDTLMPALVLLDLKLPRMDGLEVLRRVRADAKIALLPVVVLTTSRELQDIHEAYRLGANSYIRKPVNFDEFIKTVEQIGAYWLSLNESPGPANNEFY